MADSTASNAPDAQGGNTEEKKADATPKARKSTRRAVRKTTKKTPEATGKTKEGTAAPDRRAKRAVKKTTTPEQSGDIAQAAADLDTSGLGEKTRVHVLAKALGVTSRDLILALDGIGLVKVAQSTLARAEVRQLLDVLADDAGATGPAPAAAEGETAAGAATGEPVEKIRTRVRKNVANEIHQIEEKVDADLASVVEERQPSELLEDVTPEITPAPQNRRNTDADPFVPLFRPPAATTEVESTDTPVEEIDEQDESDEDERSSASRRRRRGRRGSGRGRGTDETATPKQGDVDEREADPTADPETEEDLPEEPTALRGSTRLEAQRRRRTEMREEGRRKRHIVSQAEFLARRESVERTMVVRERERHDHAGLVTQVGVLEDDLLVEHFVTSETQASMIGNIYLGRVQNVLPSMEAAFIDIGKGRNGVLYAGEVDWKSAGLGGRGRRIEQALKSGDQVLVQVSKDPVGHKGARLTTQISLAGRFLVYVPGGRSAGISRKLPGPERKRLKEILGRVIPGEGGAIIRTAAENVPEEAIATDVNRLHRLWEKIQSDAQKEMDAKGTGPVALYEEPDMLVKVVRDLFNEDFTSLLVDGDRAWKTVHAYVRSVAPDLLDRVSRYRGEDYGGLDAFEAFRIEEQLQKALHRKVWLPSGGSLVIDRTEAMTVIDVNTGKFTGSGGNLEETVTRNNLEAAEEVVRQLRLRDIGGMIVVDFIDMVLPENQDLVLRRLKEALGRDRTRHQVSEVTSLGLVQMTRKRLGTGLLETFSTECEACGGSGVILHDDPVDERPDPVERAPQRGRRHGGAARDAVREQNREQAGQPAQRPAATPSKDIEELAAAVVITDDVAEEPAQREQQEERASRRSRRNLDRSRRAEKRDVRRDTPAEETGSDIEAIVAAAVSLADEVDPDEPSGADLHPITEEGPETGTTPTGEKTFQQAVAEFEASPRRRRRTRGNSRSDHRPRQEEFRSAPVDVEAASEAPTESTQPPTGSTGDREEGRRRGRRDTRAPRQSQRDRRNQRPERVEHAEPSAGVETPERAAPTPAAEAAPSSGAASRRRRRVVRRVSGATEAPAPVEKRTQTPEPAVEQEAQPAPAAQKKAGRGRRRATRRTTSR